jgi:cyclopropane-fatty-acyl-phospholipid synthase
MKKEKEIIAGLAAKAGITMNGGNPWDPQVHNEDFYARVMRNPYLGLGESYMEGWWDCRELDEFFNRVLRADLDDELKNWTMAAHYLKAVILNYQTKSRSLKVAQEHYDIGNHLYELMLGKSMAYTCGYWKDFQNPSGQSLSGQNSGISAAALSHPLERPTGHSFEAVPRLAGNSSVLPTEKTAQRGSENLAQGLDEAQDAKYDLICRKVGLKPGMKVLDLGCGFGGFLKYAAEHYKVSGVGVNISKEQIKFAKEASKGLPLDFQLMDYREAKGTFDRVISIGLTEHIGYKNYQGFLALARERLTDDGLFLLHTIGSSKSTTMADPWTNKYIFPNGHLPSIKQLGGAMEKLFVLEDWHNFGADYYKTLMAWHENFAAHWPELKGEYDDRFYRMWTYYLLSCAGAFRARSIQLWQLVLSKQGVVGGYETVR